MKKMIHILFIVFSFLFQSQLIANTVIVKGNVKDSSNHAIANRTVRIYTDSSNASCLISHTIKTNPNGYYIDSLSCNGDIKKLYIVVENCNGTKIIHEVSSIISGIVESNFIICTLPNTTPPVSCHAAFSYTSTATGVRFNSAGSQFSANDSIISRTWSFGDSTELLTGNRLDPTHAYTKPGIYNVCLSIKTKNGCESKYCSSIVFTPGSNDCNVQVKLNMEKTGLKTYRFNSSQSTTLLGDTIVQRIWNFGDGSSLDGNRVDPSKEYKDTGTYFVCLRIRTAKGCEKTECITVKIKDSLVNSTNCKASFTFTVKDSIVTFNSSGSQPGSPLDSIISRTWYFMDGNTSASLTGNIIQPTHIYMKPGVYTVYLLIKTKGGCEGKYSAQVTIAPISVPANCKAVIKFTLKDSTVYFNSEASSGINNTDSIISRTWNFKIGDSSVITISNVINPGYSFQKPGNYNIYLLIKTKSGCESKTSVTVTIPPKPVPTNCKAVFTYTLKDSIVYFNSEGSHGTFPEDSIISRNWYYRDSNVSVSLGGNVINPSYKYNKAGTYTVTLVIKTKNGCESKFSGNILIAAPRVQTGCKAYFSVSIKDSTIQLNSEESQGSSNEDSVIRRAWYFHDHSDSISLSGNIIKPVYTYSGPGTYIIYLVIKTKKGCESKFAVTVLIPDRPVTGNCKALFSFTIQKGNVSFNSIGSSASSSTDSIVGRSWIFGDNSAPVSGNLPATIHTYLKPGTYTVILYIKTKSGCESKYAASIVIAPFDCKLQVSFTAERIGSKKVQFNSSANIASGDSIIQRNWKFGDNTILSGNVANPVKEFPVIGVYNTCLKVKTLNGCEAEYCKQVVVQDSINLSQTTVDYVRIVSLNPNPVVTRMMATIWSRNNNVASELTIFDIYGMPKWTIKINLVQGNNIIEIPTASLYHGPYFFKVSTRNGRDTKAFYKL